MKFEEFKKLIPEYIEGDLQGSVLEEFTTMLSESSECQKELEAYEKSWEMLSEVPEIEPQADYMSRFWTRISAQKPWYVKLKESLASPKLMPVYVTACVVVIVGIFAIRQYGPTGELAGLNAEEIELIEHIELAENYDIIQDIEFLADLDVIDQIDMIDDFDQQSNVFIHKFRV